MTVIRQGGKTIRELRNAALTLADHSKAYPQIPRYEHYGHRRKPYRAYLILYTVETERIVIDAILHSAQDYEALLFPDA